MKYIFLFSYISFFISCYSQILNPRGSNYIFGRENRVLISKDTVQYFPINFYHETSACISDTYRNLLLYSDGVKIYNHNGNSINDTILNVNGTNLGRYGANQSLIFLPSFDEKIINLFTTTDYSIYNKTFDHILIEVNKDDPDLSFVKSKKTIDRNHKITEGINAILSANGRDYFVAVAYAPNFIDFYLLLDTTLKFVKRYNNQYWLDSTEYISFINFSIKSLMFFFNTRSDFIEVYRFKRKSCELYFEKLIPKPSFDVTSVILDIPENKFIQKYGNSLQIFDDNFQLLKEINFNYNHFGVISHEGRILLLESASTSSTDTSITSAYELDVNSDSLTFLFNIKCNFANIQPSINYSLCPELEIGFTYDIPNCKEAPQSYTVMFKDTSSGHFYRIWDFGDGTTSDTLWVTQHAEWLGKVDTFQTVTHTYSRPGRYKVKLKILNPYNGEHLPPGEFLMDSLEQWIIVPDCIYPNVEVQDTLCVEDTLKLKYTGTSNYDTLWVDFGNRSYTWNGQQLLWISPEEAGQYRLKVHAYNSTFDTVWIYPSDIIVLDCDELWIPNAFTPNKDGLNDVFNYVCRNCVWHRLEIFNRDAQPIFRCEGTEPCIWLERTEKGAVPDGVYVYRLKVRKRDGREVERVGTVTVMR